MKIIKGWRKISHDGGYLNENTGQTLILEKKQFSQTYHVSIYAGIPTEEGNNKIVSPEFSTFTKAETYAIELMKKHPNGVT